MFLKSAEKGRIVQAIYYVMIFCVMFNIFGMYSAFLMAAFVITVFNAMNQSVLVIENFDFLIAAFFGVYILFSWVSSSKNEIEPVAQFMMLYMMGRYMIKTCREDGDGKKRFFLLILLLGAVAISLNATVTVFSSDINSQGRLSDFWTGQLLSQTQLAAWEIMLISFMPFLVVSQDVLSKTQRILLLILVIASVASVFILSSRTGLIVVLLALILSVRMMFKIGNSRMLAVFIAFCLIGFIFFIFDLFGLRTAVLDSNLVKRLIQNEGYQIFKSERFDNYAFVLSNFFSHMLGGYNYRNAIGGEIHNIFLDLYDEAGIVALVLFLIIAVLVARRVYYVCKNKNSALSFRLAIGCWFFINTLQLMVEPVWDYGSRAYLAFFFFSIGALVTVYNDEKREKKPVAS